MQTGSIVFSNVHFGLLRKSICDEEEEYNPNIRSLPCAIVVSFRAVSQANN